MGETVRFGVSLDSGLLEKFDALRTAGMPKPFRGVARHHP